MAAALSAIASLAAMTTFAPRVLAVGPTVEPTGGRPGGQPIRVAEEFSGLIVPGCAYHARVNGTLQPEKLDEETRAFRPDLRVETWVDCTTSPRHEVSRLRGPAMSQETIQYELERRALVGIAHAGVVCVIAPEIHFDGHQLDAGDIRGICRRPPSAIGGGPRAPGSEIEGVTRL
jgi:hypothetical protein